MSPVAGRIDEVSAADTWEGSSNLGATRGGLSVSILGWDGVRYYGSHLGSIASGIAPGARVASGQLLGRVGDSGDASGAGTHLHFGISWPTGPGRWWVRRGMVAPQPYLDAWRLGRNLSPAAAVAAAEVVAGDTSQCAVYC